MRTEKFILDLDAPAVLNPACSNTKIAFWLVALDRTCLIWLGEVNTEDKGSVNMDKLVVAMMNYQGQVLSSNLLNESNLGPDEADDLAESLSRRISNRFKIQVFVSEDLKAIRTDELLVRLMEKKVVEKLKEFYPIPN